MFVFFNVFLGHVSCVSLVCFEYVPWVCFNVFFFPVCVSLKCVHKASLECVPAVEKCHHKSHLLPHDPTLMALKRAPAGGKETESC